MTSAEYHNALHKRCPIFFFDGFISIYRETYFVTGTQCIYFMACTCSMKINFLRIVIVDIVDRNCIGLSVISIYGKNATSAGLQKSLCRVDADFIFLFTNCSEHDIILLLMLIQLPIVLILLSSTFLPLGQEVSPTQRARSIQIFYCFQPLLKTESYLRFTISNSFLT